MLNKEYDPYNLVFLSALLPLYDIRDANNISYAWSDTLNNGKREKYIAYICNSCLHDKMEILISELFVRHYNLEVQFGKCNRCKWRYEN